jgi:hypothetical protein
VEENTSEIAYWKDFQAQHQLPIISLPECDVGARNKEDFACPMRAQ